MDAKLMLVLTFTTIVVVTGYPSDPHTDITARLSPAKSQTVLSCGSCFYLILPPRAPYCVKYCLLNNNYYAPCWSGLDGQLKKCNHPGINCLTCTVREGWHQVGKFEVCTLNDGTHCYFDPITPDCEAVQNPVHVMEQKDGCMCVQPKGGKKICSPRGCDRLVDMEEEDNRCSCLEDGKGNKVCSPQGCDSSLVDMEEQDNECFCLEDGKGDKVCIPEGCDAPDGFIADLHKLEKEQ